MTPKERATFGITEVEEREISRWILDRMASIVGSDGRGGSGVCVYLSDGRLAVLTARHVVIRCILTGEMSVMRTSRPGVRSVEPAAIQIDGQSDSAVLVIDDDALAGEALTFSEWSISSASPTKGTAVVASGIAGEWKCPDVTTRRIPVTKVVHYWTAVTERDGPSGLIVCDVDESNRQLPRSFRGMSGGPLFSLDRQLLGINKGEIRRKGGSNEGELFVTPIADMAGLHTPFSVEEGAPKDYLRQEAQLAFWAVDNKTNQRVPILVYVEFFWSRNSPETPDGRVGRIIGMRLGATSEAKGYVVNTEAVFRWYNGNTDEDRLQALQEELEFFVEETGFRVGRT